MTADSTTPCWRCGTNPQPGDRFCGSCGAELATSTLIADPFAEPSESTTGFTTGDESRRSAAPLLIAVVVLVGLIGFFVATRDAEDADGDASAEEPAIEEVADDADPFADNLERDEDDDAAVADEPDVDDTSTDEPDIDEPEPPRVFGRTDFEEVGTLESGELIGITTLGDSTFVFTQNRERAGPIPGAAFDPVLSATERNAAGDWIGRGIVIDGIRASAVTERDGELLVTGVDADFAPALWRSTNGVDWAKERLPAFRAADGVELQPARVVATRDAVIVEAVPIDAFEIIDRALVEADLAPDLTFGWRFTGERTVEILGPWWFVVDTIDLAPLGVEEPNRVVTSSSHGQWLLDEAAGADWQLIETSRARDLLTGPDLTFVRNDSDRGVIETSSDGLDWSPRSALAPSPSALTWADGSFLARSDNTIFTVSADLTDWRPVSLPPLTREDTRILAGSGDVIALSLHRAGDGETPSLSLVIDEFVVRFANGDANIQLERDGVITHQISSVSTDESLEAVTFDPETGLTFLDDAGDPLLALSLDDLRFAAEQTVLATDWTGAWSILISDDQQTWTRSLMNRLQPDSELADLHVDGNRVTAFVLRDTDANDRGEQEMLIFEAVYAGS